MIRISMIVVQAFTLMRMNRFTTDAGDSSPCLTVEKNTNAVCESIIGTGKAGAQ